MDGSSPNLQCLYHSSLSLNVAHGAAAAAWGEVLMLMPTCNQTHILNDNGLGHHASQLERNDLPHDPKDTPWLAYMICLFGACLIV